MNNSPSADVWCIFAGGAVFGKVEMFCCSLDQADPYLAELASLDSPVYS